MTARLLDALTPELREAVEAIGRDSRNMLGRPRPIQDLVRRHFETFEALAEDRIGRADIARLLAEAGVAREDGRPLPETTISSARTRARAHMPAIDADRRATTQYDAAECGSTRDDAKGRNSTQKDASRRRSTPEDAIHAAAQRAAPNRNPATTPGSGTRPPLAARPPPQAARRADTDAERAAELLINLQDRS